MVNIVSAQSQVVAGTNYRIDFQLTCPDSATPVELVAVVFVPLPYTNAPPEVISLQVKD